MTALLFAALLYQHQIDPVRAIDLNRAAYRAQAEAQQKYRENLGAAEQRDFEIRFNALTRAFDEFMKVYNDGRGRVWPHKEAIALEKAMADLQRTSAWKQGAAASGKHAECSRME